MSSAPGVRTQYAAPMEFATISANVLASKDIETGAAKFHVSALGTVHLEKDVKVCATMQECALTMAPVNVRMLIAGRLASCSALRIVEEVRTSATIRASVTMLRFACATYGMKVRPASVSQIG